MRPGPRMHAGLQGDNDPRNEPLTAQPNRNCLEYALGCECLRDCRERVVPEMNRSSRSPIRAASHAP